MKARWKWILLAVIAAVAIAWVLWGPFSFQAAAASIT